MKDCGSMREIAASVELLLDSGADGWIARVASMEGLGGRRSGEAMLVRQDGSSVGRLLNGSADEEIAAAISVAAEAQPSGVTVRVPIGDGEAVAAGLACGGHAEILIQRVSSMPTLIWEGIRSRRPQLIASVLHGDGAGTTLAVTIAGSSSGTLGDTAIDAATIVNAQQALVRKGGSSLITDTDLGPVLVEFVSPQPVMAVLGDVALAHAIAQQGALLGWTSQILDEREGNGLELAVEAVRAMGPVDGVVVLSHDVHASCVVLAEALQSGCGYVGALGSRHTQALRAQYLAEKLSIAPDAIARICGPVGLDLGARTPEETAMAIYAEALMVQRDKSALPLRTSNGAING